MTPNSRQRPSLPGPGGDGYPPQQNLANDYQAQLAVDTLILNGGMPATGMLN